MVKNTLLLTALFLLLLGNAASALAQQGAPSFAHTWSSYSEKEKHCFITGLATGIRIICTDITVGRGKDSDPEHVNKQFRECFNAYVINDPAKALKAMDDLYNDKKNAFIPFDGIYKIAGLKLQGQNVDAILEQSRQYAEGLKKKLAQEIKK